MKLKMSRIEKQISAKEARNCVATELTRKIAKERREKGLRQSPTLRRLVDQTYGALIFLLPWFPVFTISSGFSLWLRKQHEFARLKSGPDGKDIFFYCAAFSVIGITFFCMHIFLARRLLQQFRRCAVQQIQTTVILMHRMIKAHILFEVIRLTIETLFFPMFSGLRTKDENDKIFTDFVGGTDQKNGASFGHRDGTILTLARLCSVSVRAGACSSRVLLKTRSDGFGR